MTKKVRKLMDKYGWTQEFAKDVLKTLKPEPGAPGSFKAQDLPPDDGGHPVGPGGHVVE